MELGVMKFRFPRESYRSGARKKGGLHSVQRPERYVYYADGERVAKSFLTIFRGGGKMRRERNLSPGPFQIISRG